MKLLFIITTIFCFSCIVHKLKANGLDYGSRIYDARLEFYVCDTYNQTNENLLNQFIKKDTTAEQYCVLGEDKMKQKSFTDAYMYFNKAVKLSSTAKYFTKRAVSLMFLGKIKEALIDFDNAIKIDSKYAEAYLFKGSIYQLAEDYDKAIEYYTKAINADAKYADAYMMRGLLLKTTNGKDACNDLKKAIELGSQKAIKPYEETCK